MGLGVQNITLINLRPRKEIWYPSYREVGKPRDRSGWVCKVSHSTGFEPRTVQLEGSRDTNYVIPTPKFVRSSSNGRLLTCRNMCKGFLVNVQLDAQIPFNIFIYSSLHVSGMLCSSSGETDCINTASGKCHSVLVAFTRSCIDTICFS